MNQIEKLNHLINQLETKIETPRVDNLNRIQYLYRKLELDKKHDDFETLFEYKAMNLAGISLKDENFAEIRVGTYIQIISISYQINQEGKKVLKNSSLGYFGKAEKIDPQLKNRIIEFILRWRYEKTFRQAQHYTTLLSVLNSVKLKNNIT